MTVYVDDMFRYPMGRFGRMKMSHMVADSEDELIAMAVKIGLAGRWLQSPGMGRGFVHFDVSMAYRERAIKAGAVPLELRALARMTMQWKREDRDTRKGGNDARCHSTKSS